MRLTTLLVVAAIAVGCSGERADEDEPSSTDLRISVSETGSRSVFNTTVTCTEAITTSPEKCERLRELESDVFAPVPGNVACAEIFGGPQVAEVRGTFKGRRIDATFNRTDACEIARWDRVRFLFPVET